ncbi:MAG TPA: esterase-like activity of phytase family protein [Aeromicrobium sp.]|nr:esterase-like activity of phytase family protein [Aeromicrobium sp.]
MRPTKLQTLGFATVAGLVLVSLAVLAGPAAQSADPNPKPTSDARPLLYVTPVLGATGAVTKTSTLPDLPLADFQNALLPDSIDDDRGVKLGSIGSGLFPLGGNEYWTVTDRGPNPEVYDDVRTFIVPTFDPTLVHIKVRGESIDVIESIPITNADGKPVTGMPNRAFGEESPPLAADAETVLPYNINGLDPEGIVRTANGHFWVSEEYATSIVELDAKGHILKRHLPAGTEGAYREAGVEYPVVGSLPSALQYRKANRGLEDLALLPDGKTIVAALQSSIVVPGQKDRIITELLTFDTTTGETLAEFPYQFDDPSTFNDRGRKLKISALVPVDADHVVVQERTDEQSRYYLVKLDPADDLIAGADKKLVVNLAGVDGVPDKIEGAWLKTRDTLVLINDNDFAVAERPYADGENIEDTGARTQVIEVKLGS